MAFFSAVLPPLSILALAVALFVSPTKEVSVC